MQEYLSNGFGYTETPRGSDVPLDTFLFEEKAGYCQQFSGAMALLLRMAGIPARIAAGFSPGTRDDKRGEMVVRDIDAHSWVEAYFPEHRLGHVRSDAGGLARPRPRRRGAGRSRRGRRHHGRTDARGLRGAPVPRRPDGRQRRDGRPATATAAGARRCCS